MTDPRWPNISFNRSEENAYLTLLLNQNEKVSWNGCPESVGLADKKGLTVLGIIGVIGTFTFFLLSANEEYIYLLIFGLVCILLFGLWIGTIILEEGPKNTEYYITSEKIIKIKYGLKRPARSSSYLLCLPLIPPIMHHHHYVSPKDVIYSLDLDNIKHITYKPWKKNDTRLMHITFYSEDIRISEFISGELFSKATLEMTIKFKYIEDWNKIRQTLDDLLPYEISDISD